MLTRFDVRSQTPIIQVDPQKKPVLNSWIRSNYHAWVTGIERSDLYDFFSTHRPVLACIRYGQNAEILSKEGEHNVLVKNLAEWDWGRLKHVGFAIAVSIRYVLTI